MFSNNLTENKKIYKIRKIKKITFLTKFKLINHLIEIRIYVRNRIKMCSIYLTERIIKYHHRNKKLKAIYMNLKTKLVIYIYYK